MPACQICHDPKSSYLLNNKLVCMICDELLFDIEIECEEILPAHPEIRVQMEKVEAALENYKKLSKFRL